MTDEQSIIVITEVNYLWLKCRKERIMTAR